MSFDMTIKVHSIADDGLPPEDMTNVALIFDGCIVSGWPLGNGPDHDQGYSGLWEADSDVGHRRPFFGVTHWVEFPMPLITVGKDAA